MTSQGIERDIDHVQHRWQRIMKSKGRFVGIPARTRKFRRYAVTSLRGGTGKSTLAFNLAYQASNRPMLLLDACPQRNLSRLVFGKSLNRFKRTLYEPLIGELANVASARRLIAQPVKESCDSFHDRKCFVIPGSEQLFLFPSLLYSMLAHFSLLEGDRPSGAGAAMLGALLRVVRREAAEVEARRVLIDTGQAFGGPTHLAWMAAQALIVPVRADQGSIEALRLTLQMLDDPLMDFRRHNAQAGIDHRPVVHAVVLTHCRWNSEKALSRDKATREFIGKVVSLAKKHRHLFSEKDVRNCIYLLDDFHSTGRISGTLRTPIALLEPRQPCKLEHQSLEVSKSVSRYKRQLRALSSAL